MKRLTLLVASVAMLVCSTVAGALSAERLAAHLPYQRMSTLRDATGTVGGHVDLD